MRNSLVKTLQIYHHHLIYTAVADSFLWIEWVVRIPILSPLKSPFTSSYIPSS